MLNLGRTDSAGARALAAVFCHGFRFQLGRFDTRAVANRLVSWTAPAERSGDGAFGRADSFQVRGRSGACESGVALRLPPQSKTSRHFGVALLLTAFATLTFSLHGALVSFNSTPPTPGPDDIYNFTGATFDADNIGGSGVNANGGTDNGGANDDTTYVAINRPLQGQTFLTGTNANGYDLTAFTLQVVGYSNNLASGANNTYWNLSDPGFFRIRVIEIRDGTNGYPHSIQYVQAGGPGNPGAGNSANGPGTWLTFKFEYPVHLDSNSVYGVEIQPAHGSGAFFEWRGIRDAAANGNPYTNGSAFMWVAGYYQVGPVAGDRVFLASLTPSVAPSVFTHPSTLHTDADFLRMSNKVASLAQPWKSGWDVLLNSPHAQTWWPANPVPWIVRGSTGNNYTRSQRDAQAIYQLALRWRISGDTNAANHAVYILNAWANTLLGVTGDSNLSLGAGICGYLFAIGAEHMLTYPGWAEADRRKFKGMMKRVFYPANDDFLFRHHDNCSTHYRLNWDSYNMASVAAIGVLTDNRAVYQQALGYFYRGDMNGNIHNAAFYVHENGLAQGEEANRDQGHNLSGWWGMAVLCQIGWNQGDDLYAYDNNRVLRCLEYNAKFNLWNDVPSVPHTTCDLGYVEGGVSWAGRGIFVPMYEMVYNHYVNLKGIAAPYSKQVADAMRPEPWPDPGIHPSYVDWLSLGTLTYTRDPFVADLPPSGVTAKLSGTNGVLLNWWGSAYATNYVIKRATVSGGPYTNLVTIPASDDRMYYDTNLVSGATYYYVLTSLTPSGETPNSAEVSVTAGPRLLAYLKFNETTGTNAVDATSNNISGTLPNGGSWTTGKYGNAVNLASASSQYVNLPENLTHGLTDFTISTWVYLNSLSGWARIWDFGHRTQLGYEILTPSRYMMLTVSAGGGPVQFGTTLNGGGLGQSISGTTALAVGSWQHVAVTLSGKTGVLYVNGVPVGTNNNVYISPDQLGATTLNTIGRSQFYDPYLNGRVDDFRIYSGAMNAAQIATLYATTPPAPPAAPSPVNATAVSANQINLTWNPSATATSYTVKRSLTPDGPYATLSTINSQLSTNFSDTALTGATTYYYVIAANNDGGQGTNSAEASATTLPAPPVPTNLVATGLYGGQVVLTWDASAGATSYIVKRSLIPGSLHVPVVPSAPSNAYTNTGLTIGATYYFVVSAVNANGESANSTEASALVPVPTLVWKGNVNSNWDQNTTTNWLFGGSPSTYFADGAAAIFNDTATTSTVNLAAPVVPHSLIFSNSSLSYTVNSANGSSIGGAATLQKWGTGAVTLNNTNSFTGDMTIMVGSVTVNGLLGGGDYPGDIANYGTFTYNGPGAQTLSGVISLPGSLLKSGAGTLTLSGGNTYSGSTVHRQGALNLSGAAKTLGGGGIYVVDNNAASTSSAKLNISSSVTANQLWLGDRAGSGQVGAAYQTGGDVVLTQGGGIYNLRIGSVNGSGRGYYKLSGGTLTANEAAIGSTGNDTLGIFDITGGTFTDNGWLNLAQGSATSSGLLNITGGSAFGYRVDMNWATTSGAIAVVNVGGGANAASLTASPSATLGVNLANSTTAGTINVVNLRTNGTLTTGTVRGSQANPTALLNFDGGTLKANLSSGTFLTDPYVDAVYVYASGGTIDNGGKSIAVGRPLLAPTSLGVNTINGPSVQGSGYVAPPLVTITGGTGSGATAYAVMADDGTGKGTFKVAGFVITSRGVYTVAPTTVTLTGGGATTPASGFSVSSTANTSGGMTFKGAGTTFLSGASTYTGPTVIAEGTVKQGGPLLYLSFDNTNGTTVVNGGSGGWALNGTLTGSNVGITNAGRYGKGLAVGSGAVNSGYVQVNSPVVNFHNSGTWSWAMWIKSTNAGGAYMYQGDGGWVWGHTSFYLNNGSTTGTKGGGVRWGQGWQTGTATLNNGSWHHIAMTCTNGTKTFYVDGAVDAWAVSQWNDNATGNQIWIGGSGDTSDGNLPLNGTIDEVFVYNRALSLGEITNLMNGVIVTSPALPTSTDLTVASGASLVLVSSNQTLGALSGGNSSTIQLGAGATPTSLTFGKNTSTTFAGNIAGNGSVTKIGTGDITLSGVNAYSGTTTISNGTVRFGQSDNTNYVASLGPLLWFDFNAVGDGIVTNQGLGGETLNGEIIGAGATVVSGRYGSGLSLDGTSYISIPNKVTSLDCNADGAPWTYALWIKTSTAGASFGYQGDGTWSANMTTFYLNNNSGSGTKAGGVRWGEGWMTGTATLNNNTWRFVAITVSGGVKTIYVDGNVDAQAGTTGWNAAGSTSANQFWIGDSPDVGDGCVPFNGQLDEVMLFNRALTQAEVRNILSNKTAVLTGVFTGQLPPASPVNLGPAGTLDLSGTAQTVASLSDHAGSGGIVTNSAVASALLTINTTSNTTFSGPIGGGVNLAKSGSGTQILNGANNYTGNTTVNAGTLAFGQATLPTNGLVTVTNGAVLSLNFPDTNRVAALVLNGASQSPGVYSAANASPYLAGTGSLLIPSPVANHPTNISYTFSDGNLTLFWPADHTGWRLQAQTNGLSPANWFDVPNASTTNLVNIPISTGNGSVFFRLIYP